MTTVAPDAPAPDPQVFASELEQALAFLVSTAAQDGELNQTYTFVLKRAHQLSLRLCNA